MDAFILRTQSSLTVAGKFIEHTITILLEEGIDIMKDANIADMPVLIVILRSPRDKSTVHCFTRGDSRINQFLKKNELGSEETIVHKGDGPIKIKWDNGKPRWRKFATPGEAVPTLQQIAQSKRCQELEIVSLDSQPESL